MRRFWQRWHLENLEPWIVLALAVMISLILMATSETRGTELARIRLSGILEVFTRPFSALPTLLNLRAENTRLRSENTQLKMEAYANQEILRENERLRRLLDFKVQASLILRSAEVLGRDPLPGVHSLLLGAGSTSGFRKHMAVINDQGLVGQIVRVSGGSTVVQLLTDRNASAAVRLSESRADGTTSWIGGQKLLLRDISNSVTVHLGEEVLTSGLDGIFPPGIPVGQVVRTERSPESLFLEIEIKPAVDFTALEEVFVVWDRNYQTP